MKVKEKDGTFVLDGKHFFIHMIEDNPLKVESKISHNKNSPRYMKQYWMIECEKIKLNVYSDISSDSLIESLKDPSKFLNKKYLFRCIKRINTFSVVDYKKI